MTVNKGERVAIIGRSGPGKTTLLWLLMTLERPTSGSIEIAGIPMWPDRSRRGALTASERHLRAMRARVGMVFQQFNPFPHMTVLENVAKGPRHVLGLDRRIAEERAGELLVRVGLRQKLGHCPSPRHATRNHAFRRGHLGA